MNFIKNMKTRSKLITSFIFLSVLVIVLGAAMLMRFSEMKDMFYSFHHNRLIPSGQLGEMQNSLSLIRLGAVRIGVEQDATIRQTFMNQSVEDQKKVNELMEKISAKEMTPEEKKLFDEIKSAWKAYDDSRLVTYRLALQGKLEESRLNARNDATSKYKIANEKLERMIAIQGEVGVELYKEAESNFIFARNVTVGLTVLAVAFAIGMGLVLTNIIATPLHHGVNLAEAIAGGDLTQKVDSSLISRDDEIGQLMKSLDKMSANLKGFMSSISQASNQIASASEELSSTAEQMSKGMQQQTSQTSQIASAMEQMSATVLEVAKNSQSAASSAKEATSTAQKGGDVVSKTVGGMQRIAATVQESARTIGELGKSSDQIGEIVAVIDDIADQTNLLALNAAIEAARAGEQGRGFAVVADEVRKLAERTTKATKEIATMIKNIQKETGGAVSAMEAGTKEVTDGVNLANQAGESLRMIMTAVDRVNDMINQIATASEQQSSAAEEISNSIEGIATVTKETASGSGQSAAASQELSRMATELQRMVGQYKV